MEMSEHILPKTMKEDPINIFRRATSKQEVAFALGFKYNYFLYLRGCPACFLILKGVVISSHETNRFS